jgi:hypothetical protein
MKQIFTLPVVAGICFSLLAVQLNPYSNQSITKKGNTTSTEEEKKPAKKANSSRNNHAVKIYPDPVKRVMHVVAKDGDSQPIDFFVFDLEGTLVVHHKMAAGDHEKITGLERGKYLYQVFNGDEETASGQIDIR